MEIMEQKSFSIEQTLQKSLIQANKQSRITFDNLDLFKRTLDGSFII